MIAYWCAVAAATVAVALLGLDRRRLRRQLARARHQASHDSLTGLPNRAGLHAEMSTRRRDYLAVMFDLDGFKMINDTYGHDIGDLVLCTVARRLAGSVGVNGFAARLAGDEFIALLPLQRGDEAGLAQLHADVVGRPVTAPGVGDVSIKAALGACLVTPPTAAPTVLKRVDLAMYRAKRGGNSVAVYSAATDDVREVVSMSAATDRRVARSRRRRLTVGAAGARAWQRRSSTHP